MHYFIGWPFTTDGKDVTSAGSVNPNNLTNWFTDQVITTDAQSSILIVINLGSTEEEIGYLCLYNVTAPDSSLSPTWQGEVYDGENATGVVIKDTGTLSAVQSFPVSSLLPIIGADPPQLIHVFTKKEGGREVEDPTLVAKSISYKLTTSSPALWTIGYTSSGPIRALSAVSDIGTGFNPTTPARHRPTLATGGGSTHSSLINPSTSPLNIPHMGASDAETIRNIYTQLGSSSPFFLYPSAGRDSRLFQGGIVRFSDSSIKLEQKNVSSGSAGRYRLSSSTSPWR